MLYLYSRDIGNSLDNPRVHEIFQSVDCIFSEDTREFKSTFGPYLHSNIKVFSFYKDNEFERVAEILELIRLGKNVLVLSEAGVPVVQDPGFFLLKQVIKEKLPYTVIPGPSAITTAVIHSGFNPTSFLFRGYFPRKDGERRRELQRLKEVQTIVPDTLFVYFESPHRMNKTLSVFREILPDTQLAICREMTKTFEEIVRGKASEIKDKDWKGEITIVVS